jgi:hypothetical protein
VESRWRLGYISQKAVTSHGSIFSASWVRCGVTTLCIDFLMPWPFLGFVGRCLSTCPGSQSTLLFFPGLYSPYMYVCRNPRVARNTYILIFPGYTAYSTVLSLHTHNTSWGYTFWKRPDARFPHSPRPANWSRAAPRSTLAKKSGEGSEVAAF